MQRKIFIAIDIDERARRFIDKKVDKIRDELSARWINRDNYHITLSFLGYLEDDDLIELGPKILEALKDVEIFDIHLNRLILAPDKENPKMVWLVGDKNQELIDLRYIIEQTVSNTETCLPAGKVEKKEFRPHINLGKLKGAKTKDEALEKASEIERDIDLLIPVTGVRIFESEIKKKTAIFCNRFN
ncbi:MAG: RNA 2',3'-cyclic phosphodiesterase [Patescibacteria group bacterium]|jgi:2'-5' RNA ligase|nr:RNA 2',3'-cyclic phosphodiesterase [Patescibacteria group bacterium]